MNRPRRDRAPSLASSHQAPVTRVLPRGAGGLPRDVVLMSQRSRIAEGAARAVAEKGYADATVADIIAFAGVSRTTFYQLHPDKEGCFLACFEGLSRAHHEVLEQALAAPAPHPERLLAGLRAYMARVDADAWFARAFIGEAEGATPAIRAAYARARARLRASLRAWFQAAQAAHPELRQPSDSAFEMVDAGIAGLVVRSVRDGQPLRPLVPEIAAFAFAGLGLPGWAEHARGRAAD